MWEPRATHGVVVGYNGHIIYRVYVENQNRVIQVKNPQIFEDNKAKPFISLLGYKDTPTFQGFFLENDDVQILKPENVTLSTREDAISLISKSGRKIKLTLKVKEVESITYRFS